MKTATTYEDRIALIKEIAERKKKMASVKVKSKSVMERKPKVKRSFLAVPNDDTSKNPNYYTDEAKYAKEYYGETFYQTTRFDNEWD